MVAVVTACGAPAQHASAPTLSDEPPPLVAAMPLPDNAVDNAVAKLDGMISDLMASSGIPGMAVAVVHGGKTLYAKGFGVRDAGKPDKVDADTVFQLASLSKPISATVVAHQVGTGAIRWDTPVVEKLPWFALSDPAVTGMLSVGDLFSHRSGLPDHAGDMLEDLGYDRRTVLERLRQLPLSPFRTSYAYTNFGVTAAAEAVAAGAGEPWAELCDRVLYRPLGMSAASSRFADYAGRTNKAVGHVNTPDGYQPRFTRDPDAQSPAGGVSASVNDLTHWLMMVLADGRYNGTTVVDPAPLLAALTPQIVSDPPTRPAMRPGFYGYGFNVGTSSAGRTQFSHSGAFNLGAATNFVVIPSADVAIVALTNAAPSGVPETLTAEFGDLVQFGEVREDWRKLYAAAFAPMEQPSGVLVGKSPPDKPAPARPLTAYTGSYANPYWGPVTVTEKDRQLSLTIGPRPVVYPLRHWDGDVFTFGLSNENASPGSISQAVFDGDTLTLEYYDADKMGTFTR
jgi:CubicO group peptidase (beta-lactamase class C family)